jgi:hypothetical protein
VMRFGHSPPIAIAQDLAVAFIESHSVDPLVRYTGLDSCDGRSGTLDIRRPPDGPLPTHTRIYHILCGWIAIFSFAFQSLQPVDLGGDEGTGLDQIAHRIVAGFPVILLPWPTKIIIVTRICNDSRRRISAPGPCQLAFLVAVVVISGPTYFVDLPLAFFSDEFNSSFHLDALDFGLDLGSVTFNAGAVGGLGQRHCRLAWPQWKQSLGSSWVQHQHPSQKQAP